MGVYNIMFIGGLILAILFLILSVVLFFALKIPQAWGAVTGATERKAIEEIRAGKSGEMIKKKRKSQSRIVARDIKTATATGTLVTGDTDIQKSSDSKQSKTTDTQKKTDVQKKTDSQKKAETKLTMAEPKKKPESKSAIADTKSKGSKDTDTIAKEAKEAFAKDMADAEARAEEKKALEEKKAAAKKEKQVRVNPKTGKRYELDAEETEVLTYKDMHDNPEDPTTFLGAKMPGEDEATDILREGMDAIAEDDLYDDDLLSDEEETTSILAAGMAMDLDREETDILTSTSVHIDGEEYNDDDDSEAETDVLTADGSVASKNVEKVADNTADKEADKIAEPGDKKKPTTSITDMLRKAMEEGKNVPDLEPDEDEDDEDEEYSYSESEEITSVLRAEAAAKEALTQDDVNGILDENLTSVLRADMMPGAEPVAPKDDKRIDVLYAKTIVHTEETL